MEGWKLVEQAALKLVAPQVTGRMQSGSLGIRFSHVAQPTLQVRQQLVDGFQRDAHVTGGKVDAQYCIGLIWFQIEFVNKALRYRSVVIVRTGNQSDDFVFLLL